jgi:hypothetical protein
LALVLRHVNRSKTVPTAAIPSKRRNRGDNLKVGSLFG